MKITDFRLLRVSKLTKASRHQECTLQIHPFCDWDVEKTVPCHLPSESAGTGIKSEDWWLVDGCHTCHSIIDGRITDHGIDDVEILLCIMRALHRTINRRIEKGLITIA